MRKFFIICLILSLILFTAFIKNSTKKIEDQIFTKQENLRSLRTEYGKSKLEYESSTKLYEQRDITIILGDDWNVDNNLIYCDEPIN